MFTVTFLVSFGPRKGNLSAYASYWYANFKSNLQLGTLFSKSNLSMSFLKEFMSHRFQFTVITSRTTTYILFLFWCFFFFFGEILLLIMFNFNTVSDLIPSHYFISTKNHVIFLLDNSSTKLSEVIMFYIIFLSLCSFNYLLRLDLPISYDYERLELNSDTIFLAGLLFWVNSTLFYLIAVLYVLNLTVFNTLLYTIPKFYSCF